MIATMPQILPWLFAISLSSSALIWIAALINHWWGHRRRDDR